jgi:hypothetical protein
MKINNTNSLIVNKIIMIHGQHVLQYMYFVYTVKFASSNRVIAQKLITHCESTVYGCNGLQRDNSKTFVLWTLNEANIKTDKNGQTIRDARTKTNKTLS